MSEEMDRKILTVTGIIESLLNNCAKLKSENEALQLENKQQKMIIESLTGQAVEDLPILLPLEEIIKFTG
jgi:regulator of replication initiation timing